LTVNKNESILAAMTETPWYDEVVLPALLRAARTTYGRAIRHSLAEAELGDLPRNGAFVLGGLGNRGGTLGTLTRQLGVTKQAASQLIDTLVSRGYLNREPDPADRRRVTIELTDRGRYAASLVRSAVESIDAELAERLAPAELGALRAGLGALIDIDAPPAPGAPEPDSSAPTRLSRFAPIFPVRDLARGLAHYADLGFRVSAYRGGADYGFADRGSSSLHLSRQADLDPLVGAGAAYLYVADADALAREWARPAGGRTVAPVDTDYGLREGAHIDPDGNLVRFGSPLAETVSG
jgi:DNA-binding MarR family transcriptional regulator